MQAHGLTAGRVFEMVRQLGPAISEKRDRVDNNTSFDLDHCSVWTNPLFSTEFHPGLAKFLEGWREDIPAAHLAV